GRLVRPFHPGLSVWVTVHVFVWSCMFSLGGTFTLRAARLSLAHRIWIHPPSLKWPLSLLGTSGEKAGLVPSNCRALLKSPLPDPTAIELRSADFSPPRSGPAKTAGSGLKSALLSCRNSLYSMAVLPDPPLLRRGERESTAGLVVVSRRALSERAHLVTATSDFAKGKERRFPTRHFWPALTVRAGPEASAGV